MTHSKKLLITVLTIATMIGFSQLSAVLAEVAQDQAPECAATEWTEAPRKVYFSDGSWEYFDPNNKDQHDQIEENRLEQVGWVEDFDLYHE